MWETDRNSIFLNLEQGDGMIDSIIEKFEFVLYQGQWGQYKDRKLVRRDHNKSIQKKMGRSMNLKYLGIRYEVGKKVKNFVDR